MNDKVIGTLYNTVPHPPASYLGPAHCFRQADGAGNNLENPDLGRAGTPYARSVQAKGGLPRTALPDAGLIYDTLLKKKGVRALSIYVIRNPYLGCLKHQNHSGGMSSMIFAFASLVTHSLFRTNPRDININDTSSYLDLSPLYGDSMYFRLMYRAEY
jgi:linoleate 10R-lipoxygenase